jgi:hypothetical protein
MSEHRITYEVLETVAGTRYRAVCKCGTRRIARNTAVLSSWGPEHVIRAFEAEHAA